jgi:hypothetical protein
MSGGVSATTTGPNATQQMNASHSAHRYLSIHTGTEQIPATEPTSDVALRLNPRVWVGRALYAFESQFPLWPHEWRHPTPVSPVRATVKRLFIGSAPDALLLAAFRFLFVKTLGRSHLPDQIPFPKCHKRLPAVLSQEDVTRLIASSLMHRTMIMTLYATGVRRAELYRLVGLRGLLNHCIDHRCWNRDVRPGAGSYFSATPRRPAAEISLATTPPCPG